MYEVEIVENVTSLAIRKDVNVHLLRKRTLALGRPPFEQLGSRRFSELDAPYATQLDESDDDPLQSVGVGQDFALLLTRSGKVRIFHIFFIIKCYTLKKKNYVLILEYFII